MYQNITITWRYCDGITAECIQFLVQKSYQDRVGDQHEAWNLQSPDAAHISGIHQMAEIKIAKNEPRLFEKSGEGPTFPGGNNMIQVASRKWS